MGHPFGCTSTISTVLPLLGLTQPTVRSASVSVRDGAVAAPIRAAMHRNVRAVVDAAAERGLTIEPRSYPDGTRTAQDAADAIGVEVGQIVKSLVFLVDDRPTMALVPGDRLLDESLLAAATRGSRVERPDGDAVRAATGFPIGGVPPLGHPPVYVDEGLLAYDEVWAAAGTWTDVFPVAPDELVRVTGGTVCELSTSA